MRPTLNVLSEDLIRRVLDEAKRIMGEIRTTIAGDSPRYDDDALAWPMATRSRVS